ncbi:MAG: family N-acetyltransferase [Rhodoferax sp.]|nr:family N-acetyltransferase [Rhodoferax sp.]
MQTGDYTISDDPNRLDPVAVHAYLTRSYWSPGVSLETVGRAMGHSLCLGIYHQGAQVGYARVVTDKTTFAYLADVYVLEAHRGQGLSKRLIEAVQSHPDLQGLRRFLLATRDAHSLYAQFGFKPLANPTRMMEVLNPDAHLGR